MRDENILAKKPKEKEKNSTIDFKPTFDVIKKSIQKELIKRKKEDIEIIEETQYEQEQETEYQEDLEQIKRDINPILGIIFNAINLWLTKGKITSLSIKDKRKIEHFIFAIIEKSIATAIQKYSVEVAQGTSTLARIWEFLDIVFNIITPRIEEYYTKKKAGAEV